MTSALLQATSFRPTAPARRLDGPRNTVIENIPQVSIRRRPPGTMQPKQDVASPLSDDFPTPKAQISLSTQRLYLQDNSESSDSDSDQSTTWNKRGSENDFDEMYDVTGSESEEVPLKLSSSIKARLGKKSNNQARFPSLVIPSPSHWPTIEKLKSATALSPPLKMEVSPAILSLLRAKHVPSTSSTPSLDGSLTSEELAASSCPSTPDIPDPPSEDAWDVPIQLDPSSISLLHQINGSDDQQQSDTVIEIPEDAMEEMREIVDSPPITGRFKLDTHNLQPPSALEASEQLSGLSVPSPGGFFASLDSSVARTTWAGHEPAPNTSTAAEFYGVPFRSSCSDALPTSTATSFYNLPWETRPENPVEQIVSAAPIKSPKDPITARRVPLSPMDNVTEVDEIDEHYDEALKENATANMDRTQLWLSAQDAYMQAVCEDEDVVSGFENLPGAVPTSRDDMSACPIASPSSTSSSPSKKAVRFAAEKPPTPGAPAVTKRISPIHDGTFWEGWRHMKRSQRARDVFQHRQARAEADQVKRISMKQQHANQLSGRYEITDTGRPSAQRPVSSLLPTAPEDEKAALIARANRERQALEQMQSSSWHLEAQREVNGGKLLTSPIVQSFKGRKDVKILDLAGQVSCSWAWSVAHDHPAAAVYTTVSSDAEAHVAESCHEGPDNHIVVASPNLWALPFEDDFFDVVSGRKLYTALRTIWPKGKAADEWDLTLRECLRVLKPGGYLEFDLLDAELAHADPLAQALGVEFAYNLKTRGYDPISGKSFLPRLKRAGFHEIKRAWMVLPVADSAPSWNDPVSSLNSSPTERSIAADGTVSPYQSPVTGSTKDVRAMTGLVGARMWEQWMLKLNVEMGRNEKRCLDDVAKALEEAGKGNAGWRCLVGWARKDTH